MTCFRNQNHNKKGTVCEDCLKELTWEAVEPDLNEIDPELRALFTQLTIQNRDITKCWKSSYKTLRVKDKTLNIENILYAFYKADIGNFALKRICPTVGCVNPAHHRSRFEAPNITKKVRTGFSRTLKEITELTDDEWRRLT